MSIKDLINLAFNEDIPRGDLTTDSLNFNYFPTLPQYFTSLLAKKATHHYVITPGMQYALPMPGSGTILRHQPLPPHHIMP